MCLEGEALSLATVGDAQIFYEAVGQGAPIVLIMGLGGNIEWWGNGFRRQLGKGRQVIAVDNRGAGRTVTPPGHFSIEQMADDVVGVLDVLGFDRADVFGVSMGGMIAQEIVLRHGHRVNKLLLGCTTCGGTHGVQPTPLATQLLIGPVKSVEEAKMNQARLLFPEDYIEKHRPLLEEADKMMSKYPMNRENFMRQFGAIQGWQGSYQRLPSIQHATLIMHGTEDILLPSENSDILHSRIANSQIIMYEGAGHGYMVQNASKVIADVQAFLE